MDEADGPVQAELGLRSVADMLRDARVGAGLSLEDIAAKTRIPLRHLIAMEASQYDVLPGKSYAVGFAKSYARAVGLDEPDIASKLRTELGDFGHRTSSYEDYEPVNSARLPSRTLALTAAALAIILVIGYAIWRSTIIGDTASETPIAQSSTADADDTKTPAVTGSARPAEALAVASDAPVIITASSEVWMGFNDPAANGRLVFERTFKAGEAYTVPPEARNWTMRTSRAQVIQITVGGKAVPPIGRADVLVKDVPLDPTALAKRTDQSGATPPL